MGREQRLCSGGVGGSALHHQHFGGQREHQLAQVGRTASGEHFERLVDFDGVACHASVGLPGGATA
jgi:hypothetical protein